MKKIIAIIILLIVIVFCAVVWAGLDAGSGYVTKCSGIGEMSNFVIRTDAPVAGLGTHIECLTSATGMTSNRRTDITGDFILSGEVVGGFPKIRGEVNPSVDDTYTLGSPTKRWKTFYASENIHGGTASANYRIDVKAGGDVGSDTFTGSGLDDLTAGGTFNGTVSADISYKVEIDSNGTPDTFKWSDDGGSTWDATTVSITGSAQTLNNGVTVTFGATDGHTTGDYWTWTVTIHNPMWLQDAAGGGIMWAGNDSKIGINTESPSKILDVVGDVVITKTTQQLELEYDGSNQADFTVDSGGDLTITASGGDISFGNEALSTTGTGYFGAGMTVADNQYIGRTGDSDMIGLLGAPFNNITLSVPLVVNAAITGSPFAYSVCCQ